jgi:hypothetical protein
MTHYEVEHLPAQVAVALHNDAVGSLRPGRQNTYQALGAILNIVPG